jgi:dTDP-4-amino-4,6-dideoxygalactose transaminase
MTDVQASLGLHQLPKLDTWIDRRAELWERYERDLKNLPLSLPPGPGDAPMRHARHLFPIEVQPDARISRDQLLAALTDMRIGVGVHYQAVHLHRYYREKYQLEPARLPVSTRMSERTISLPLSPKITDSDYEDVVAALRSVLA